MTASSHKNTSKNLIVWRKAVTLAKEIYLLTELFPREETHGLTSQMRRAAISIPSNIAEGRLRGHEKEFRQFLLIAFGSGGELETQIEIAKQLPETRTLDFTGTETVLEEVMKMLNVLISKQKHANNLPLTPKA